MYTNPLHIVVIYYPGTQWHISTQMDFTNNQESMHLRPSTTTLSWTKDNFLDFPAYVTTISLVQHYSCTSLDVNILLLLV